MTRPLSIVLFFGSGVDSGQVSAVAGERSRLESILQTASGPVDVCVVSFGLNRSVAGVTSHIDLRAQRPGLADRLLKMVGAYALHRRFATFPIGRLLNSMGPVDPGRVFWRAVRRSREALSVIRSADTAIAADMPAVKTAWISLRRGYVQQGYYDHRAASLGVTFQLPAKD